MEDSIKLLAYTIIAIAIILSSTSPASAAFTQDQGKYSNLDGSPKFSDPDDQMPGILSSPADEHNMQSQGSFSFGLSRTNRLNSVTPEQGGVNDDAFEQAYQHQSK